MRAQTSDNKYTHIKPYTRITIATMPMTTAFTMIVLAYASSSIVYGKQFNMAHAHAHTHTCTHYIVMLYWPEW